MSTGAVEAGRAARWRLSLASPWALAVWAATVLYAVVLSAESVYAHTTFATGFDSAIYDQRLWLLANWQEPFSTVVSRPFLADHFEPGLVLLTPLYWVGFDLPGLLVAQSIGLALTAPALFALARAYGSSPAVGALPAFLWLASPAVAAPNLFDFRPATFAPALIVLSVLAAKQERHWLLAITAILALSLKEDIALVYVVFGLLLVLHSKRRVGATLAVGSASCAVIGTVLIRSLGEQFQWQGRRFAGDRGDSFVDVVLWAVQHPLTTFGDFVGPSLIDLAVLVLSTAGLALLAPSWMLLAAPTAVYNALSAYEPQHTLIYHYHLQTLTAVSVAAAIGSSRVSSLGRLGRRLVAVGIGSALAIALVAGIVQHDPWDVRSADERSEISQALDRIPPGAPVAAAPYLLPHLSHRVEVYSLPEPFIPIDWGSPLTPADFAERAKRVRFAVLHRGTKPVEYLGSMAKVRRMLSEEGFVPIRTGTYVQLLERRR